MRAPRGGARAQRRHRARRRGRACEAGFSTRNWNSWFQTGARWRPAWLVSSSRRLRTDCPPSATRAYGLLCQGKPQTGRLRASSSVTCARARASLQPAARAPCPAPVRGRCRAHLPWKQSFLRRPVAQARGAAAGRGAPQAPPAAPCAGHAPAAQSLQAGAPARAGRSRPSWMVCGQRARGSGVGCRVRCAAARLQLAVEGVRQRHAARRRLRSQRQRRDERVLQRVRGHVARALCAAAAASGHGAHAPGRDGHELSGRLARAGVARTRGCEAGTDGNVFASRGEFAHAKYAASSGLTVPCVACSAERARPCRPPGPCHGATPAARPAREAQPVPAEQSAWGRARAPAARRTRPRA